MNIVELSEKNILEAKNLFLLSKSDFYQALGKNIEEVDLNTVLKVNDDTVGTYMLADKGVYQCLVTVNKPTATIENLWINFDIIDEQYLNKFMEFVIKQFSAITLVFIWVDSLDEKLTNMLENYGFEYTGEQNYLLKDKNLLAFRYMYRRKK